MSIVGSGRGARSGFDHQRGDKGASAVLVAISALVLMGFTALAIDSGILFSDRRQQQSAADAGALAAVQFARTEMISECSGLSGASLAACRGADEAIAVINGTLNGRYSEPDWAACTDPDALPFPSNRSPCITYSSSSLQEVRVRLPGTDVRTPFGGVIGISSARVGAFAHATADLNQSAEVLPFAVGPTGAAQDQTCLSAQASPNLDAYPCNGPDEGNFGKLDLSLYGNTTLGTPQICGNAMPSQKMATNIVVGADHPLEKASDTPGTVMEVANCPVITNPVDNIPTQTGNAGIEQGLFHSIPNPSLEGRLRCKNGGAQETGDKTSVACEPVWTQLPEALDDTPLWQFIDSSNDLAGADCPATGISNRAEMEDCLAAWKAGGPWSNALFTDDIRTSPRFAAVPILVDDPGNGFGNYDIIDFKPIYLQTIYVGCNPAGCSLVHSPGESNPTPPACPSPITDETSHCSVPASVPGANRLEALSAFMLDLDMLPASITDTFPGMQGTIVYNLNR
jgi:hypothetical protein